MPPRASNPDNSSIAISERNSVPYVSECRSYLSQFNWSQFDPLFAKLLGYANAEDALLSDEFVEAWNAFMIESEDILIQRLQTTTDFDAFREAVTRLATVLDNPQGLWAVLNQELKPDLRITLNQAQILSKAYFTPTQLFEFGFEPFIQIPDCSLAAIRSDEAVIDVFYAIVGFIQACDLPDSYIAQIPSYISFLTQMLSVFAKLPDFDPHRFVWLVEMVRAHLHIEFSQLLSICERIVTDYVSAPDDLGSFIRLYKLCVFSTSKTLIELPQLKKWIDSSLQTVVSEQQTFVRKNILISFADWDWNSTVRGTNSDAARCWRLYIRNFAERLKERPEMPPSLLPSVIADSIELFVGFFGSLQPSKPGAATVRADIFLVVDTVSRFYPGTLPIACLKRLWYLLYIAAVSGAKDADLQSVAQGPNTGDESPFLGLDVRGTEFANYALALEVLRKKFEGEAAGFAPMAEFIRAKYGA
jgi:hypothetical protein